MQGRTSMGRTQRLRLGAQSACTQGLQLELRASTRTQGLRLGAPASMRVPGKVNPFSWAAALH